MLLHLPSYRATKRPLHPMMISDAIGMQIPNDLNSRSNNTLRQRAGKSAESNASMAALKSMQSMIKAADTKVMSIQRP